MVVPRNKGWVKWGGVQREQSLVMQDDRVLALYGLQGQLTLLYYVLALCWVNGSSLSSQEKTRNKA